jgi:hypothetical protein
VVERKAAIGNGEAGFAFRLLIDPQISQITQKNKGYESA